MRPIRIEVEGFSAYRSRVVVDLSAIAASDMPFFSLSGATGAGKSSLIDAMIFALYGRIPRLGGREVAPVISAGTDRARVRFVFDVDGTPHTAVRLAQRTPNGGATVKEARLERGGEALAEGADRVTAAVEDLLHLNFDNFTRTVVLPQGDFARFLSATKSERQALLRRILGLEVHGQVRELANNRHAAASARAESARNRLDALELPEPEELEKAKSRLITLERMAPGLAEREHELAGLAVRATAANDELARLGLALERLQAAVPPDDLDDLGNKVSAAREALADAEEALAAIAGEEAALRTALDEGPDQAALALMRRSHDELREIDALLAATDPVPLQEAASIAGESVLASKKAADAIRDRLDALRVTHAAHAIEASLVVGGLCPVCRHPVDRLPVSDPPIELRQVEDELKDALARVDIDQVAADTARAAHAKAESDRATLLSRRDLLDADLTTSPKELERLESVAAALQRDHAMLRVRVAEVETKAKSARGALEDLASREHSMGRLLRNAMLQVADLDPPVSESDDVVVQWKDLVIWRDDALVRLDADRVAATEEAARAMASLETARQALLDDLIAAGVALIEPHSATLAVETEKARQVVAGNERTMADVTGLTAEIDAASSVAAVAAGLAGHLKADGFERWMMSGTLETLVAGANDLLGQLSDGGYSLHSEEGSFSIVDHRNADERRSVSTLSGGETFLVSLALALSLAETLAGSGDASLDAIILDEGFGTLDDESLDTVASVLEELAGERGLMVGVITHVKELANRAAVRFEVMRGARGSTVEEVT